MASQRIDPLPCLLLIGLSTDSQSVLSVACPQSRCVILDLDQAQAVPDLISRESVGLVFCGLDLSPKASLRLVQQIRQVHPHLPVLMVISHRDFELALAVFRNGADDLLVEPLSASAAQLSARQALQRGQARGAASEAQQHVKRSLDELVLLRSVGETASREENLQRLLERIVTLIQAALAVEIVSIMLAEQGDTLRIRAACGLPDEVYRALIPAGEGIAGHVFQQGEPVLMNDLATDGRFAPRDTRDRYRSGSLLSVPIRYQERILGVLNVNNKQDGQGFSSDDQNLLTAIAHQAALAIENLALVSRLQQKSQELGRVNADLLRLHEGRTRFVCNLSHELKTPLTSVLGYVDLLTNFYDQVEPEQVCEYLARTREEALRLDRLLSGMLRLFSLDSGQESWCWGELDLLRVLQGVLDRFQPRIAQRELVVSLTVESGLALLWGDRDKLSLLLGCLLDNAVKFNVPGGRLVIHAENRQVEGRAMIYLGIGNDGQRVPVEAADEIFEAYAQLGELDTGKPHGVGVGLATCRVILRQMQGRIFLEPYGGRGTRFGLFLPTRSAYEELNHEPDY